MTFKNPLTFSILLSLILVGVVDSVRWYRLSQYGSEFYFGFFYTSIILFLIFLVIIYVFLRFFIFRKIREIYWNIHELRRPGDKEPPKGDILVNLHNEVEAWTEERKNEIEQLKKLETYRREFLGNVSHELKTPIFNIQGYILTLLDGGLEDPKINRDYLKRAEKSVERMIGIVEDLQAITQLESGELELELEKFDIVALAKDVVDSQEMKAKSSGVTLIIRDEENKPVMVVADKFRIRQVLTNLIVNSLKYGRENGETRIRFYDSGDHVTVEVADTGLGISKEHLPRIFERFYRVDKSRSREQGGTGLGLAIVKHIIEAHGQNIQVMSTEGVGSVFSFSLKKG